MIVKERIELRDELIEEFKKHSILKEINGKISLARKKKFNLIINSNNELCDKYLKYINEFSCEEEAKWCILHRTDVSKYLCPVCNKPRQFYHHETIWHYRQTCGDKKCINSIIGSDNAKEKRKNTNLEKFGVQNPFSCEKIKEKIKETNLKLYGVENPAQSEQCKNKSKQTCLEKYNKEYATQCNEIQDKIKQTNLEIYGTEYAISSKEVRKKSKNTMIEKFGVENAFQSEEIKDKIKRENLEKFGVENYNQQNILHYEIWQNDDSLKSFIINQFNKKCSFLLLNEMSLFFNIAPQNIKKRIEKLDLLQYFYIQESNLEIQFKNFLNDNNVKFTQHNRNVIFNYHTNAWQEIDFLIDDFNIGFEINDIASHNAIGSGFYPAKDKFYHYNKTLQCAQKGIRLIHLWEWELRNSEKWNKICKWILNLLNKNKIAIDVKECEIGEVTINEGIQFLNDHELSENKNFDICLGLYYNSELIGLESFCKTSYNNDYELVNLCFKFGADIINGAKELLHYFIDKYNCNSIIKYLNLDKFTDNVYIDMGFKLNQVIDPQLIWCDKDMKRSFNKLNNSVPLYDCGSKMLRFTN